jgi:hypothetical protein
VQQRCGLLVQVRVGVLAEGARLRSGKRRLQQAVVADLDFALDYPLGDPE